MEGRAPSRPISSDDTEVVPMQLVHVVDLDQSYASGVVLSSQDRRERARWQRREDS